MPSLVPGISLRKARCPPCRDHRDKPGDDERDSHSKSLGKPENTDRIFGQALRSDQKDRVSKDGLCVPDAAQRETMHC